jgi:16S rRNA (guanine527-N7)-methyltransferase
MMDTLTAGAAAMGLPLTPTQIDAFAFYAKELLDWNQRFNLTAITDPKEVQTRHFLDSLALLPALVHIDKQPLTAVLDRPLRAVDVGPGPGFPGLALKIVWPNLRLCLIEATEKKIQFMKHISGSLGLKEVTFVHARAEDAGQLPDHRELYELVTARAVAALPTLVEYLLPLARVRGRVVAYKAAAAEQEVEQSRNGINHLGGRLSRLHSLTLPETAEARTLVFIQKVKPTPKAYPRSNGLPKKRPL